MPRCCIQWYQDRKNKNEFYKIALACKQENKKYFYLQHALALKILYLNICVQHVKLTNSWTEYSWRYSLNQKHYSVMQMNLVLVNIVFYFVSLHNYLQWYALVTESENYLLLIDVRIKTILFSDAKIRGQGYPKQTFNA